jgi:hypothetical protein
MARTCEVCTNLARVPESPDSKRLRRLLVGSRIVTLCAHHAERAHSADIHDLADLRALFVEETGQRSLVAQRAPLDRRVFPPRPEGRRRGSGRRATDGG